MANDEAYDITGVVGTAIGIFCGVAIPLWLWLIYCRLPRSKIQLLESLLSETDKLLTSVVQEGIIDDVTLYPFHGRLFDIKRSVHLIRADVYNTRNIWQDIKNWWTGLSLKMSKVCEELQGLRAEISERCSDAAGNSTKEVTTLLSEASFKQLSSQRASHSFSSVEKLPLDVEPATPPAPAHVIIPADVVQAGDGTKGYLQQCLGDRDRLRVERRRVTRQILLRLGRELAAGLGVPYSHESCCTSQDTQKPHGTRCDHSSDTQTSLKSPRYAPEQHPQSHSCCEGPLVIELVSELLLDALDVPYANGSSDDEGDSDDDNSCDLGTAKLQV